VSLWGSQRPFGEPAGGYKNLYNITDGFEGDKITDKNDPNYGERANNGWKDAGVPRTYDLDINLRYLPYGKSKTKSKVK